MDRNFILAIAMSLGVILLWDLLIAGPQREEMQAAREAAAASQAAQNPEIAQNPDLEGLQGLAPEAQEQAIDVDEALALSAGRVPIRTPSVEGSISLQGGRIDDLKLLKYRETLDDDSPVIRLLSPRETEHGHYAQLGWITSDGANESAVWTAPAGAVLTPDSPVTLTREASGLVFEKTISVDEKYMFTMEQIVRNESDEAQNLTPYALVVQRNIPEDFRNFMILHEGPVGVIGGALRERKYNNLRKNPEKRVEESGAGGWVGVTNKNWLAAAVPPQDEEMTASLANVGDASEPIFRASYSLPARSIAPGQSVNLTSYIYGGAKDVDTLKSYQASPENGGLGVLDFDKAVDWGHLFFLTRPIFFTLNFFGNLTGSFGLAILILTLIIKAIMFPLANKGYASMSKMKKLQPEVEKLRKRYGDDRMKQQQEMMALYKKEKMNPLAGCLPILLQMPIFYALYKTLFVTIELRHQPFLYIQDLAARDPTSMFNLFGLLPYDPTAIPLIGAFLGIGILPLLMGVGMWFQMKLNPPPPDPVQAQIFGLMPIIFVFIFAPFAAGLVLYWFWNTLLSILQQWFIMKRHGVDVDWGDRFKFVTKFFKRDNTPAAPGE